MLQSKTLIYLYMADLDEVYEFCYLVYAVRYLKE